MISTRKLSVVAGFCVSIFGAAIAQDSNLDEQPSVAQFEVENIELQIGYDAAGEGNHKTAFEVWMPLAQRWSRKFGPVAKMNRPTKRTIGNDEEKTVFERV